MRKLLQATSAMALMLMSTQAFASNAQNYDDDAIAQVWAALASEGMPDNEIADIIAQTFNQQEVIEQPAPMPVAPPVAQASVVSIAVPAPAVEEALRYSYVTMHEIRSSNDLLAKYNTVLDALRLEFEAKTNVGNSKYGLMPYLNKPENRAMRLNPLSWDQFPQKPQMFATDPEDVQIVPAAQQAHIMQCLTFNDYLSIHKFKIAELENIAENEPMKDRQALLNALVNPNVRVGSLGNFITNVRNNPNIRNWF